MKYETRKFAEHSNQISPLELISENSKQKLFNGSWPEPQEVENLGVFSNIKDSISFNNIVGNPENWNEILNRNDLFEQWILPHAVIFFGKTWFDRVKYSNSISRGAPFPLFYDVEKNNIESTSYGKSRIAKIVEKTYIVLYKYFKRDWCDGEIKQLSGYIVNSLKNEFIREVGLDMGYKSKNILACPYCLSLKPSVKVRLLKYSNNIYSCPRCKIATENLEKEALKDIKIYKLYKKRKIFESFIGITCICPSNNCLGKFIPISCFEKHCSINLFVPKSIQSFKKPPNSMLDLYLTCPYCETKFTPRMAIKKQSGFKEKSGLFTGLPSVRIWTIKEDLILDDNIFRSNDTLKNQIVDKPYFDDIYIKQKLNLLIDEIIIQLSKTQKNTSGLVYWYFLISVINWIIKYNQDANNYFFNYKTDKNTRGEEVSVHQTIFYEWMRLLENNIKEFTKLDPKIKFLKDFGWFCRKPKFTDGPKTEFYSIVDEKYTILNNTSIKQKNSKNKPRLVRVYSIKKNGVEFINDVDYIEWNAIKLKQTNLKVGDEVFVEAIVMSGHHTHSPIQRILRLRSSLNIIDKILEEEETGNSDQAFWKFWKQKVKKARKETGITVLL